MSDNTINSFTDKWEKNPQLVFKDTLDEKSEIFNWILNRNGFSKSIDLKNYLADKARILDAGCGNGRVTALLQKYAKSECEIIGIDIASADIAKSNLSDLSNVQVYSKDLMNDLSDLGKFDFIYSQEVLHHTVDPFKAFQNLCALLNKKGEIAIYVYKKKAPVREYVDDFIRNKISSLSYEEAYKVCEQITKLAKELTNTNVKINVPNIPELEIIEGEYDIQRFFYHFFMKCFWNDNYSFNDNVVINYDWFHPQLCFRYNFEEVKQWFNKLNLHIVHQYVDFYGITIRGQLK